MMVWGGKMYYRIVLLILCCTNVVFADDYASEQNLRKFPPTTVFATIQKIDYPQLTIEEIPSNSISGLLGMVMLHSQEVSVTPASVIRDKLNNTQLLKYIDNLSGQAVAIQPDFQGRAWVIWQLTDREKKWVIDNKLNIWK